MGTDRWAMELCPLGSDILMHQPTLSKRKSWVSLTEKDGGKLIMHWATIWTMGLRHSGISVPREAITLLSHFCYLSMLWLWHCHLCSLNVHLLSCKVCQESWLQPTHRVYLEVIRHKAKYSSWAVLSLVNSFHSGKWPTISQGRWAKQLCLLDSFISTVKSLMHKQWAAYQWAGRYFGSLSLIEGILEIKAPLMPRCLLCDCYWGPVTSISFCFYNTNKGTKVFAQ